MFSFIATPFGYVMRFIYEIVGNYGLSILLFALFAKLLTLPFSIKSKKGMLDQQRIQPKMLELQKKYGKDKQKYTEEVQKLYDAEGVSMMGGCLPTLITFPIMFGLYYVISQPLTYFMQLTTAQINQIATTLNFTMSASYTSQIDLAGAMYHNFDAISHISDNIMMVDFNFLGMNLAATPSFKEFGLLWLIPILSCLTAFLFSWVSMQQQKKLSGGNAQMQQTNMMMMFLSPLMSGYFGFILPAGLGVYWIINNILMALQEVILNKVMQSRAVPDSPDVKTKPAKKKDLN